MDVKIAMQNAGIRIAHSLVVFEMRDCSPVGRLGMTVMLAVLPVVIIWQVVYIARAIRHFYFAAPRSRVAAWTVSAVAAPVVYLLNSLLATVLQLAGAAFAITRL